MLVGTEALSKRSAGRGKEGDLAVHAAGHHGAAIRRPGDFGDGIADFCPLAAALPTSFEYSESATGAPPVCSVATCQTATNSAKMTNESKVAASRPERCIAQARLIAKLAI